MKKNRGSSLMDSLGYERGFSKMLIGNWKYYGRRLNIEPSNFTSRYTLEKLKHL